ncbi:MAG TPA: amidohydrolase family protein [Caulobacteraceae bacterium]|jgi:imidazolonepropionase-like amidohydrolase|nr:amidohydrolase family protein [Caulobacteraceae bacterium]
MFTCSPGEESKPQGYDCPCHNPAFARLSARMANEFSRRSVLRGAAAGAATAAFWPVVASAHIPEAPKSAVAFTNAKVFDGKSNKLLTGVRVVVQGDRIKALEAGDKPLDGATQVIDCGGRTLMPGLIDAHWHAMGAGMPFNDMDKADVGYLNLVAGEEAERTVLRGFTSVRDVGGPSFGLKRAIDTGVTPGPRIWPSGAAISQTGGHGDHRTASEVAAGRESPNVADGVDAMLKCVREQLLLGASHIKLCAGGGIWSDYDPIDSTQYTEAELRAAVEAAENWNTYVTVHAYTPRAVQTAVRAGVKCIEHGHLIDEETARILADKGIWLSLQPFLDNAFSPIDTDPKRRVKQIAVHQGTDTAYGFAKKYKIKTAWGTDIGGGPQWTVNQGGLLASLDRWYTPVEILKMATGANGELCALSGPRNPYPAKIGVIEPAAYADLLLVDGDPTADIRLVADPGKNFKIIMKDGRIYKNTLV